jgi:hypothetical protein
MGEEYERDVRCCSSQNGIQFGAFASVAINLKSLMNKEFKVVVQKLSEKYFASILVTLLHKLAGRLVYNVEILILKVAGTLDSHHNQTG